MLGGPLKLIIIKTAHTFTQSWLILTL
ncbi:hypothetical protein WG66_008879 [Moniliophthora roreri]|nr:hypothetical protein WG66_008879 [Moniliophthora roreri]